MKNILISIFILTVSFSFSQSLGVELFSKTLDYNGNNRKIIAKGNANQILQTKNLNLLSIFQMVKKGGFLD